MTPEHLSHLAAVLRAARPSLTDEQAIQQAMDLTREAVRQLREVTYGNRGYP
jgi:hypothetical protein